MATYFRFVKLLSRFISIVVTFLFVIVSSEGASSMFDWQHRCNITEGLPPVCPPDSYFVNCSNRQLHDIPDFRSSYRICALDLSHNTLTEVPNHAFVTLRDLIVLDIYNNELDHVESGAFAGLSKLEYLRLNSNNLSWPEGFGTGAFKPLTSLLKLNLTANLITTYENMSKEFQYMKHLEVLFISGCSKCCFDTGFVNLTKLVHVSLAGRLDLLDGEKNRWTCNMGRITHKTFIGIPHVRKLGLHACNITDIDRYAFSPIRTHIEELDISYNEDLKFIGMSKALNGLRDAPNLTILRVNRIHGLYEMGTMLKYEHLEHVTSFPNLERLHIDLNKIEVLDDKLLNPSVFPPSLRCLTLSGNRLAYGKYIEYVHNVTNVTELHLSRQHLNLDPYEHAHDEPDIIPHYKQVNKYTSERNTAVQRSVLTTSPNSLTSSPKPAKTIYIPPDLEKVVWRTSLLYLHLGNITVINGEKLKHLDLGFNLIERWVGPITGLEALEFLDLSLNACELVSENFFSHFIGLKHLSIFGNEISKHLHASTFEKLTRLETLDISNIGPTIFPKTIFQNLTSLKTLNVSKNQIEDWTADMSNIRCLRFLSITENKLDHLPNTLRYYLDGIAEEPCNKGINVTVDFGKNPIECTCHTRPFLKWLSKSKVHVRFAWTDQCHLKDGIKRYLTNENVIPEIVDILDAECADYTWHIVISVAVVTCIISIILCLFIYKYRWKLRHFYYSKRKRRHRSRGYDRIFEYDGYLSYPDSMASIIKSKFVPALEKEHGLKLWVADRNSTAGASIAENIVHGIYSSRKSVLLVNNAYLKDSWCDYEMNMANTEAVESKRKLIIVVLMEKIPTSKVPISVLRLLRHETSLEYPDHPQHLDTFWNDLADAILSE